MRGVNSVVIAGNVGKVIFTETQVKNDPIVTFMLCIEREENFCTWAKVSAYGKHALHLKDRINTGDYAIVHGELSNRKSKNGQHMELEVKATNRVVPLPKWFQMSSGSELHQSMQIFCSGLESMGVETEILDELQAIMRKIQLKAG